MLFDLIMPDSGQTLQMPIGSVVAVTLAENPTTGYCWAVDRLDKTRVMHQSDSFQPAHGSGAKGGGIRRFTFVASAVGTSELRLQLSRQWDGHPSIIQQFAVTLEVTDKGLS